MSAPQSPPPIYPGGGLANNYGQTYGTQAVETWAVGQSDRRPLLDMVRSASMWRVCVTGDVTVYARWGTSGTHELTLDTPLDCTFPGFASIVAAPRDPQHATPVQALVSATPVWGAGKEVMRRMFRLLGSSPAVTLAPEAHWLRSIYLNATITVRGVPITVPQFQELELVYPTVITTGTVIVEYVT